MFRTERIKLSDLNKIHFEATWLDDHQFKIIRKLGGENRGSWRFVYTKRNRWKCSGASSVAIPNQLAGFTDPPYTKWSDVPEDVLLKASAFLKGATIQPRYLRQPPLYSGCLLG
jgi:hypothetical protein